ncbi:enoyl-CoA hydratase [Aspergillus bombycis]|uniref:Enoyl-CoA hydratase n=1 Tax=Aspergillus bombycis TaxID=109264 RepID=A0A1F8ADH9_9EURO|nr:enoyl-CoA hydratase [Aspergillus bombycis]OGM49727.1 enoyl-CoA hydratase [Aspergillus bombycis]
MAAKKSPHNAERRRLHPAQLNQRPRSWQDSRPTLGLLHGTRQITPEAARRRRENRFSHPRTFSFISDAELDSFAGVSIPGRHAPLRDLGQDLHLDCILRYFHARSRPAAAICHGPFAFLSATFAGEGDFACKGYRITSWSDVEEMMETMMGGEIEKVECDLWNEGAILVEGANPTAANALGDQLLQMLSPCDQHPSTMQAKSFKTIFYQKSPDGKIAYITLNRPDRFNAIDQHLPRDLRDAVRRANADPTVHCIILKGNGPGFCGGYDLDIYAQNAQRGETHGSQDLSKGYDPLVDYAMMKENTDCFSELFHSHKPTIAQVHGAAVAGGSDIALCCDLVIMATNARIGYPPSRVWGCPTTAMWAYRIGVEKAKRMLFTGDLVSGAEAAEMGLVLKAVPEEQLEETVLLLANRIASVPQNQLWMQKQVINGLIDGPLLRSQKLATIFDGITRNSPEGVAFQELSKDKGFKAAIKERDSPARSERYQKVWKSVL